MHRQATTLYRYGIAAGVTATSLLLRAKLTKPRAHASQYGATRKIYLAAREPKAGQDSAALIAVGTQRASVACLWPWAEGEGAAGRGP